MTTIMVFADSDDEMHYYLDGREVSRQEWEQYVAEVEASLGN